MRIDNEQLAMAAAAGVVFIIALIVVTVITMKIADFIIDSRVGALDRTLGFLYGAGETGRPLARLAQAAGWDVAVLDHRPALATAERFPGAALLVARVQIPPQFPDGLVALIRGESAGFHDDRL